MSSFRIATNVGALNAYNALAKLNAQTEKAQLRLATQKRINSVADDTSGFNIGKSLEAKVSLMKAAQKNVGSAKDLLATAEGQLVAIRDMITDIKAKIADSGNAAADLNALQNDIKAISDEIGNAISNTKFNDSVLLGTTAATGFTFQTGVTTSETLSIDYADNVASNYNTSEAEINALSSSSARADFTNLETNLDTFESTIEDALGKVGNYLQRLDAKEDFLTVAIANSEASVSRLFDADMAMEQLNATKAQIGGQVATSMLAQLNAAPQNILGLFR
ncbi:MAG: flagellar biosynthesis protein FliC [Melioribacteraceae bacterium]|nr:flagellar biosynthesis protein FliC [Melioribacteraceae bacterium]